MKIFNFEREISNLNIDKRFITEDGIDILKKAIYIDCEHYIYKKPIALGIFGSSRVMDNKLITEQYFLEDHNDLETVIMATRNYLIKAYSENIEYLVTFAGKNDISVIRAMLKKYNVDDSILDSFKHIDLQKEYEKKFKHGIGLKSLESLMDIKREGTDISGSTIAKTFSQIMKDSTYISRIPDEKINRLIEYNRGDCENLFFILSMWNNLTINKVNEFESKRELNKKIQNELLEIKNGTVDENNINNLFQRETIIENP